MGIEHRREYRNSITLKVMFAARRPIIMTMVSLCLMIASIPGGTEGNPTWDEFATSMERWKEGEPSTPLDALFDRLEAVGVSPGNLDLGVIHAIYKLAQHHCTHRQWDRCEFLLTKTFRWLEKSHGPDDMILVDWLMELATVWFAKDEDTRAIQALNRGLRIIEKRYGENHLFSSFIHERLAEFYRHTGKEWLARSHEQRLVALWKEAIEPNTMTTAVLLADDIPRLWQEGKGDDAVATHARIQDILKETPGSHQDVRASLMLTHARRATNLSDEERIGMLHEVLEIKQRLRGKHHPGLIPVMMELTRLYQKQGRTDQSRPLLQQSLPLVEEFFGPNHPGTAHVYFSLAENLHMEHQDEEALTLYHRAAAILRGNAPAHNEFLARIVATEASIYTNMEQHVQAEQAQMEYLTLLAAKDNTKPQLLLQAQRDHKEIVAQLRRQAGEEHKLESKNFRSLVTLAQQNLVRMGLDPGPANGSIGSKTYKAIRTFEKRIGLTESTTFNIKSIIRLLEHLPP